MCESNEWILTIFKDDTCELKYLESYSLSEWQERRDKETDSESEVMMTNKRQRDSWSVRGDIVKV